jgi:hypothetical protein
MGNETSDIYALIDEKIDADADFQAQLADLSEDEQQQALSDKKAELVKQEFSAISEKAKKAEEIATNQKIRAEKAEAKAKGETTPKNNGEETPKNENMSYKDIRALADVPEEDVDEVMDWAKFKGISIPEAKATPHIKNLLKTKAEERKTAEVASTAPTRHGGSKVSSDALLKRAEAGDENMSKEEMREAAAIALQEAFKS